MNRKRMGIWVVATGIVLGMVVFAKPAYVKFREFRADWLAREALARFESGPETVEATQEALPKALSAHQLEPQRYLPLRVLGTILTLSRPREALDFWTQARAIQPELPYDDALDYVQCLLVNGKLNESREMLLELREQRESDPRVSYHLSRIASLTGDHELAYRYAKDLIWSRNTHMRYRLFFIKQGLESGVKQWASDAENQMELLLKNPDLLEDEFLWRLISVGNVGKELQRKMVDQLASRVGSFPQELLWVEYQIRNQFLSPEQGLDYLKSKRSPDSHSELILLASWCNQRRLYSEVVELIDNETALSRRDAYAILMAALLMTQDWDRVEVLISNDNPPLEAFWFNLLKAQLMAVRGEHSQATHFWYRAKARVVDDAREMWSLIEVGDRLGLHEETRPLLEQVVNRSGSPERVVEYLGARLLKQKQYGRLLEELKRFADRFPRQDSIVSEWAYYAFLLQQDVEEASVRIDEICDEHPEVLAYHMTWAMGEIMQGRYREVLARLSQVSVDWESVYPKWRFILALALAGVGEHAQSEHYLSGIDLSALAAPEAAVLQRLRKNGAESAE